MAGKLTKGQKRLLGAIAVALALAAGFMYLADLQDAKYKEKAAQAKAYGFPFEGRDLVPAFDHPETENAAQYLEELQDVQDRISFTNPDRGEELVRHVIKGAFTDEEWAIVETRIQESTPILARLEDAARSPYCYFDKNWDDGIAVMFPEYAPLKSSVRPLLARARMRLMSGDVEGAGEDIAAVQTVSMFVSEQQSLIALLVSLAIDSHVMNLVQTLLPEAAINSEASDMLRERVEANPDSWNLLPQLRSEAFSAIWATDNLGELTDFAGIAKMDDDIRSLFLLSKKPGAVRALKSSVIDVYGSAIKDYVSGGDERELIDAIVDRRELAMTKSLLVKLFFELLGLMDERLADALDRARANRLCTLAALDAVDLYRITSSIPDGEAKGPYGYTDPFDGKDLRYRRDGEGFRVWSIGHDRDDNGGTTRDEDRFGYDVVVVFPPILQPFESMFGGPGPPGAGVPAVGFGSPP